MHLLTYILSWIGVLLALYFLPTLIGFFTRNKELKKIALYNAAFGWTVVVWFHLMAVVLAPSEKDI